MFYAVTQYLNNSHLSNGQTETVILIKPDCALIGLHSHQQPR